ncbi:MAG: 3-oxoacid CoA-transferase subunit B [Chloroflexota bacterium]
MAQRVVAELRDGMYVNLGFGMPLLVANFLPRDRDVLIHTENGMIGVGPVAEPGQEDPDLVNAGKQFVTELPGAAYFDQSLSFSMIRGRHIDVSVLGAYQVAQNGDLANWVVPGERIPRVGGAMDLSVGAKRVIVMMSHVNKRGEPKLLERCTLPLTGQQCVSLVITDLALIEVRDRGFLLREVAPGWSADEVVELTGAPLEIDMGLAAADGFPHPALARRGARGSRGQTC